MKPRVLHSRCFASDAAQLVIDVAQGAIAEAGLFRLALAGGRTPVAMHEELVRRKAELDWARVLITFGDERCVPPDHADSNYRMARETLLDHVPVPPGNVLRLRGEMTPAEAARAYGATLAEIAAGRGEARYRHDLILLGMGADGHTASLFPGTAALTETREDVVPNFVPQLGAWRLTFTYPLLNAARHVCFLVSDVAKAPVVQRVLAGCDDLPAAAVRPAESVTWLLGWAA